MLVAVALALVIAEFRCSPALKHISTTVSIIERGNDLQNPNSLQLQSWSAYIARMSNDIPLGTYHTFKGHSLSGGSAYSPHSAWASQFDRQPSPQNSEARNQGYQYHEVGGEGRSSAAICAITYSSHKTRWAHNRPHFHKDCLPNKFHHRP